MWEELKDLPVTITRWGVPEAVVLPWEMWDRAKNPSEHRPISGKIEETGENMNVLGKGGNEDVSQAG